MKKPIRVLIIEDSEDDVLIVGRELRRAGYEPVLERVETMASMRAALQTKEWDVILCDYLMPTFNAPQALNLYNEMNLDIPFIIVSGSIGEDEGVQAMKAGAHDYLMKGKLARLVPAIEQEMREAAVRRKLRQKEEELAKSHGHLEELVGQRTAQLQEKVDELQRLNKIMMDREEKILELKNENETLKKKLPGQ